MQKEVLFCPYQSSFIEFAAIQLAALSGVKLFDCWHYVVLPGAERWETAADNSIKKANR